MGDSQEKLRTKEVYCSSLAYYYFINKPVVRQPIVYLVIMPDHTVLECGNCYTDGGIRHCFQT